MYSESGNKEKMEEFMQVDEENEEEPEINLEDLNEKFDQIMKKFENLNIDKEIGEKEKNRETRIIIETIELENFKSYAGVKKIGPLHNSFNSVVGPNGSGKSNLMESLLFVFGKRAKKMRLNKLNELIHSSTNQNNLRFARVSIYFKEIKEVKEIDVSNVLNDKNFNKTENYLEIPNSNFELTREVYKNGTSKYFYNKQEIGFEQLCSVLIRKGIDLKHNRFLILQGEVEQISMMKPKATTSVDTGLLEFLEDIIGTNRYVNLIEKLSKDIEELSEIKNQKMNRVKISKNELDQLEDIKNASVDYYQKEKTYLILLNLIKQIERHLVNKEIVLYNEKINSAKEKYTVWEKEIVMKFKENTSVLEQHNKIKAQQEIISKKIEELNKETEKFTEIDSEKRGECDNINKLIEKNKAQLEKYNKNLSQQSEEINQSSRDLPDKEKELKLLIDKKNEIEKYVVESEQQIFAKTKDLQNEKLDVESKLNPFSEKINSLKSQIEKNLETVKLLEEKLFNSNKESEFLQEKKNEVNKEVNRLNQFIKEADAKLSKFQNSIKEIKELNDKINSDLDSKTKQAHTYLNKISEIKSSNQEKLQKNNILDSLIKAQNEGKLKGINGRLGDLGTIDYKYDVAITTACAALDNIVVETVEIGQKCVEFLRKNNLGRATFICLDKISWVESKINEYREKIPNAERLFDLVNVKNSKFANAFYFALRDTLVTSDLKIASSIAYGSVRRRVVTINGELIEASGVMSGGGKPRKGGMSNKTNEEYNPDYINRLNSDYDNLVKEIQKLKLDKESLELKYIVLNKDYNDLIMMKKKLEYESTNNEKILKDVDKNLAILDENMQKHREEEKKVVEIKKKINELENEIVLSEKSSKSLRDKLEKIDTAIAKICGQDYLIKKDELKVIKKKVDEKEKEVNMMRNTVSNSALTLKKTKEEIILKEKTILEYEEILKKNIIELKEIEETALKVYEAISLKKSEYEGLGKEFDEKRKEVDELKVVIKKMKEEQEKIKEAMNEYKNEISKLRKNENHIFEEVKKIKNSFNKLIDEFGFIDNIEKEIKKIKSKVNDQESKPIEPETKDDEEEDIEELESKEKLQSKSKKISYDYSKFKDPIYIEKGFNSEVLEELAKCKEDINYESLIIQNELNKKQHNMEAIKTYKKKIEDLRSREDDLNKTADKLNKCRKVFDLVKKRRFEEFMEGFNSISARLKEMYQLITHGGDAELELIDSLDPFSEGINFSVRPYKKSWKQISNLSGGEKTLSSLSLIFALHHYKPSPLYVMDEIDAALDFKNVSIIANYIKEQTKNSQFIIISLRNHMFELANKLVGIYKTHDITKCLTFDPESCKMKNSKHNERNEENKNEVNSCN